MEEIWKEYKTYDRHGNINKDLRISNLGNAEGYYRGKKVEVEIKLDGRRTIANLPIYVLVDKLFRGKLPQGQVIHHGDFNKLNDSLDNLIRMTISRHMEIHNGDIGEKYKDNLDPQATLGMHWYNDGINNEMFRNDEEAAIKGFTPGRIGVVANQTAIDAMIKSNTGKHWYNNGKKNKRFYTDIEAFVYGYFFKGKTFSHRTVKEGYIPWNKKEKLVENNELA